MNLKQKTQIGLLFLLALCVSSVAELHARNFAIVIGVSEYANDNIPQLPMVYNDADCISKTLENGLYIVTRVYARASEQPNTAIPVKVKNYCGKQADNFVPTNVNIKKYVEDRLLHLLPEDHIVVYFSGHGIGSSKDKNRTLLTACNSVIGNEETFVPAQWLRDTLTQCRATNKVLLIDSCHSGGTKSVNAYSPKSNPMSDAIDGVVTIASCTKDQTSGFWDTKRLSLFTYWLNQGLKGFADSNNDGQVKTAELFEYIQGNMRVTSKKLNKQQEPVLLCPATLKTIPTVIEPLPRYIDDVLDDFADQVTSCLMMRNIPKTGVMPFTYFEKDALGDIITSKQSSDLPAYCASEFERRIKIKLEKANSTTRVVDSKALTDALKKSGGKENLNGTLEVDGNPVESHIRNTITKIQIKNTNGDGTTQGEYYELQSRLILSESLDTPLAIKAIVSKNEMGETLPPTEEIAEPETNGEQAPTAGQTANGEQAPIGGQEEIWIEVVNDKNVFERKPVYQINGENYISLAPGDFYRILIKSTNTNSCLGARILVDGKNTLPQYQNFVSDKFIIAGPAPTEGPATEANNAAIEGQSQTTSAIGTEVAFMPRVRLDDARFWVMDPNETFCFSGFYHEDLQNYSAFEVTDAPDALEEMAQYSDQIGLITIGIYSLTKTRSEEMTTKPGPDQHRPVFVSNGYKINQPSDVIHIRYTTDEFIQSMSDKALPLKSIVLKCENNRRNALGTLTEKPNTANQNRPNVKLQTPAVRSGNVSYRSTGNKTNTAGTANKPKTTGSSRRSRIANGE